MGSNVEQALIELEEDTDYQFLRSYGIKNTPMHFPASAFLPSTVAEWSYTLYNGYLANKPVEYIKNAIKAAYFLLAVLDTFVYKAKETKHEFTFKGDKVHITDLSQQYGKSIFNGGYFSIDLDKPYLINLCRIEVSKPDESVKFTNWMTLIGFEYTSQNGRITNSIFKSQFDKLTDVFTFSYFQKILDNI